MISTKVLVLATALSVSVLPAVAQDSSSTSSAPLPAGLPSDYTPGSTVSTGTYGQKLLPEGNPLNGLFTPQPQYPTAQTQMNQANPTIPSQYSSNPLNGLFTYQNPSSNPNPAAGGTNNMLQGLFTGQNPFPTSQTPTNPQPQANFAVPGFGQPSFDALKKDNIPFSVDDPRVQKDPNDYPGRIPDPKPVVDKSKDAKDKDGKDKDAKTADKGKDAKDKDGKDKDGKDKDKSAAKDGDKDKDGKDKTADAKGDDAKDKDKDKADADTPPKPSGPYNPLQDALVLLNAGEAKEAVQVLAPFLKAHPTNAEAHYIAAVAFVSLRDLNMAAAEYRVVLHLVPATQLASLAVEGLKKIGFAPVTKQDNVGAKLPPLRQGKK